MIIHFSQTRHCDSLEGTWGLGAAQQGCDVITAPVPAVTSWPPASISRRGLAGLSEVLAPIYRDERKDLKFKLEFELRWADSVFVLFAIAILSSWPPGLLVIFLLWFGQRALNTGGTVSISGLASRAPGRGGALASFCTRSGDKRW